ncbi:MAG: T9SS type A sorting domain-containing protein [Bacteroidetes bacterium]|nr:T9SS type A sorting domain-containing protein [Bacteroidota bacterium]
MKKNYFRLKHFLLASFFCLAYGAFSQVDVSTGGPVTTYTTLSDAFTAINAGTHTGMINISITGNTTEPSTPVVLAASGVGASFYSSIRIRPAVTATISGAPISGHAVIETRGADSLIIDGDIPGGSVGQDLSIVNTSGSSVTVSAVIRLIGITTTPALGCRDNIIRNCIISGNVDPTTSGAGTNVVGILAGGGTVAAFTSATTVVNNIDRLLIENNVVKKAYYGIVVTGNTTAATCTDSLIIRKNSIGSNVASEYNVYRGIYLANCLGAKIHDNRVFNQIAAVNTNIAAIEVNGTAAVSANDSIQRNIIYGIRMPSTGGWGAYGININSGNNHSIVNNVIYDVTTTNYSSSSTTYNAFGIRLTSGTGHKIYYNSVNMFGTYTYAGNTSCASAAFLITSTAVTGLDIKNNIFNNKMSSNAATQRFVSIWFPSGYSFATTNMDYNAYTALGSAANNYVALLGSGAYSTLSLWQAASQIGNATNDVNSIPPANGGAPFIADTNLRIANNMYTLIESGGVIIPGLGTPNIDILYNNRPKAGVNPNTSPDMGAYEFDGIHAYIDLGVTAILKPVNSPSKCFNGVDTIQVRVKNFSFLPHDMTSKPIPVKVIVSGANPATYSLSLSTGTLAAGATLDTTLTLTYDMSYTGTYVFKGFTAFAGDAAGSNDTTTLTITKQPVFGVTATPNDSVCKGTPVQLNVVVNNAPTVGSGTFSNSSTSYPSPYGQFYNGAKHQFLFLASELSAAGLTAGNITSAAFNATNLNSVNPLINYNMSIGSTTLTSISAFQTGLTQIFSTASYTPVLGVNTHTFSTPFVWNGTDNIIIEACFNNYPNGYSSNVSVLQSNTPFVSTVYYRSDTDPNLCTSTTTSGTFSQRPNISFGQPLALTYSWSPAGNLSATSVPNPSITALNASALYTVTVTNTNSGCISRSNVNLVVKPTPTLNLGHDTTVCLSSYGLNGGLNATNFQWSTGATTNSISVANTGTYTAIATNTTSGCVKYDTVSVTFSTLPILTLGPDTGVCQGSHIVLNSGNPTASHQWGKVGGGFSATTQTVNITQPGTYYAVITSSLSTTCVVRDTVVVSSKATPAVSLVFNSPVLLCHFDVPRTLNEGTPSGGTYFGAGVSGNTFNPATTGPGSYVITYNYTASNHCSNQASDTIKVKNCTGVEELSESATLNAYPNPNNGEFSVVVNAQQEIKATLKLMTIDGRVVYTDAIETSGGLYEKHISIKALADGIYYLRMESSNSIRTFKILKQ